MKLLLNKLLANVLACGLVLTSTLHAADTKWMEFDSSKGGFSVDVPTQPEHVHQQIEIPQTNLNISYDTFVSEPSESVVYVVSVWHYPPQIDMSKPDVNLQDGFSGMLAALPGSQVLSMNMSEFQGYNSLKFLVKNEDIYFRGMLVLVHNTLYQVFSVYREDVEMEQDYTRFIDSFELQNPGQHKVSTHGKMEV